MELLAYDLSQALAEQTDITLVKWAGTGRLRAVLLALPSLALKAALASINEKPDIFHVQDGVLAPLAYCLSRCFRRPYVVTVHGLDVTYNSPLFRVTVLPFVRRADAVLPVSKAAAKAAHAAGVAEEKIHIIEPAIHDKLYGAADRTKLIKELDLAPDSQLVLTVGRLVRRKGVAWFIDNVLPALVEQFPKLIYLVVGDGEDRLNVEAAIQVAAMENHVYLAGRASDEVLQAAYNGADVFVMPNINVPGDMEGFGLVLLEASLCALPIVAASTEGIKDAVVEGKNAILVPVEDIAAYCQQITHFLQKPAYAKRFGQQSRDFTLKHYSRQAQTQRYLDVYKTLRNA